MKPSFPQDPYHGQIFYSPSLGRVYRYNETKPEWEDITESFVNDPTNPFKNTQ
tara:strand:+ start:1230 stop:1388 length:159 start_codon:yes stop_codon:yes gene_type:complete